MTGPDPAVAAVRLGVRRALATCHSGVVLVACSGGADSLALLAATVFETRRADIRVVGAVVDHGLQEDSADHTARVVDQMARLGADETASIRVTVDPGPRGIEAGAREARYVALSRMAQHFRADQVLLGHTRDDQAETVLLGLTRGSGGRSIAGMRRRFRDDSGIAFNRPLLDITRAQTEAACAAEGIEFWSDPHNADPRFVRARIRHTVMPMLERELGPGFAAALARTADSVREDVDALDDEAELRLQQLRSDDGWDVVALERLAREPGLQLRILRLAALEAGALASDLTRQHVLALSDLVLGPDDGRQVRLPGHLTAYRERNVLRFGPTPPMP